MASEAPDGAIPDEAVLAYLREKGMIGAASELEEKLAKKKDDPMITDEPDAKPEEEFPSLHNWCIRDAPGANLRTVTDEKIEEVKGYADSFMDLQSQVLALPDEGCARPVVDPLKKAKAILESSSFSENGLVVEQSSSPPPPPEEDQFYFPPSEKPELLSVTFALLVLTYCELLDTGMESTANIIRETFDSVYDPVYSKHFCELAKCKSTQRMTRLKSFVMHHRKIYEHLNKIFAQLLTLERESTREPNSAEIANRISKLRREHNEYSKQVAKLDMPHDLAFLKKARKLKWKLNLSKSSYSLLLKLMDDPMKKLLHSRCQVEVLQREPLRHIPPCCFDELKGKDATTWNAMEIRWAAPSTTSHESMPFPKYHLDEGYEDKPSGQKSKLHVEFNRALLVNGFRRLEALERKRELELMNPEAKKRIKGGTMPRQKTANGLEPSILITTITAAAPEDISKDLLSQADISANWQEAGIEINCAKLLQSDGQKIAAGCSDSLIRIWSLGSSTPEPSQTLIGHRDGLPVFDLDWARDGRTLLSAGGDGVIRLWDTMAAGSKGELAINPHAVKPKQPTLADDLVPGAVPDEPPYRNGAEIARFRINSTSTPTAVWSVAFAPSGYYFASSGADSIARIWTTDRASCVRWLVGHSAPNVNCVAWHPNCNYVLTGADDKTARLWDVQTGRMVRYLDGCHSAIHNVEISPSGQYAALADRMGIVYLWDLAAGKKVTEFRTENRGECLTHAMKFSHDGSALVTTGDSCELRVWDVRPQTINELPCITSPFKLFRTKQVLFDLSYTRHNLLLGVGVFRNPILGDPSPAK